MGALGWARWDGCAGMVKKHVVTEGCANLGIQGVEIDSEFLGHLVPKVIWD